MVKAVDGLINLLKPPGMTSHDAVKYLRKLLGIQRVGHAGTLDPGAAGILVIGLGAGTRLLEFITDTVKEYRAEVVLGASTDTGDAFGEVVSRADKVVVSEEVVRKVLGQFRGVIWQIPPAGSAVKIHGEPLYRLERRGAIVNRKPRQVAIHGLELVWSDLCSPPYRLLLHITCSKGTYVRALVRDIGHALGCGAYVSFLVRTRVGPFGLEEAVLLEDVKRYVEQGDYRFVLPLSAAVHHLPAVTVDPVQARGVMKGQPVRVPFACAGDQVAIYDESRRLLAIGKIKPGSSTLKPKKVFSS